MSMLSAVSDKIKSVDVNIEFSKFGLQTYFVNEPEIKMTPQGITISYWTEYSINNFRDDPDLKAFVNFHKATIFRVIEAILNSITKYEFNAVSCSSKNGRMNVTVSGRVR